MSHTHLSRRQIILRSAFMLAAVILVAWFFPHRETFRYEYEVGKPWRYGRLTAPYDFPIYRSDSAVMQMEDSLRRLIVPRYAIDASVAASVTNDILTDQGHNLSAQGAAHLRKAVTGVYARGVLSTAEHDRLTAMQCSEVILTAEGEAPVTVAITQPLSEMQAYELLRTDSLYAGEYAALGMQRYLRSNLVPDTMALRIEYARLRQQVSTTSGIVLAESRIIDQGEIVTPHIYDILESYRQEQQQRLRLTSDQTVMFLCRTLLVALILCSILLFMALYRPWIYMKQVEVFVAIGAIVAMFVLTALADKFAVGAVYIVPIGVVTVLLSTFHGSRTAYYCHIVMALLCSLIAPSHYEYLIVQCMVGMVIVFSLKDGLRERSQLLRVCVLAAITYAGIYALYTLATEGTLHNISWPILVMMLCNAILLLTSYLIIYALENVFGLMSDVTLSELCNLSKGTLLQLSQDATGTFMHSFQVANIAANAADVVGANAALVRTGAYYHDIGKLWNPGMYTENQNSYVDAQGNVVHVNPHDTMTTEASVEVIKRHVTEGVEMAQKAKLPRDIIAFIQTHHGRSQVKYFFNKWCNAHPDEEPDLRMFSYPGPDPETKEQAILMMADSVEAATRSLREPSESALRERVDAVVRGIVSAGHFDHAKITLYEIQQCKDSFVHDLKAVYHTRIDYPDLKK